MGRSRFAAALVLLGGAAGALVWGGWVLALWRAGVPPGWRQAAGCAALLAAGGLAASHWRRAPRGELVWDGAAWRWEAAGGGAMPAGELRLSAALDVQVALLVRVRAAHAKRGRAAWLWLERGAAPALWPALRRAVYSRADDDGGPPRPRPAGATP